MFVLFATACTFVFGCSKSVDTIEHRFSFDMSPCWGPNTDDSSQAQVCSRSTLNDVLFKDGPNGCLLIEQADIGTSRIPVRFSDGKLSASDLLKVDLRVDRTTDVSLFLFSEKVDEAACSKLKRDDDCQDSCFVRLTDSLAPVPSDQISKIDFKILKDGRLECDYQWGSVDATNVIDACDDVDNDCDGRVDETPRGSNLGPCCTQNSDCTAPTSLCVDRRCEVCDPNRQLGCSGGAQCILRKGRPACQGCQGDEECTANQLCRGGTCVQCVAETNEGCTDEAPICSTASGRAICLPCETGQCSAGLTCHMGACVSCIDGRGDCPHEQPVCDGVGTAAACRACQNDSECPDQTTCLNGACEVCTPDDASRCPDERPYCVQSEQDGGSMRYVCSACSGHDECLARDESSPIASLESVRL